MRHKRILTLLDETAKMQVTMWSSNATLNYQMGKVIAIRGARVSDFQGKSLNSGEGNSCVFLEPKEQERYTQLNEWFKNIPMEEEKTVEQ